MLTCSHIIRCVTISRKASFSSITPSLGRNTHPLSMEEGVDYKPGSSWVETIRVLTSGSSVDLSGGVLFVVITVAWCGIGVGHSEGFVRVLECFIGVWSVGGGRVRKGIVAGSGRGGWGEVGVGRNGYCEMYWVIGGTLPRGKGCATCSPPHTGGL
ncbi:hypothetical protein Tco_0533843 [Tanacetum coccineum]